MARLRSYLLPALVIGVLAMWAGTIDSARLFDTWGLISDAESDTGNTITAASLTAPTLNSATATTPTAPGTITLSWTLPVGDPANQIRIYRSTTGCGGTFSVLNTVSETPTSYSDSSLAVGTYCYKIQGVILNWTSPFSGMKDATIVTPVTLNDLYLKSPSPNTNTDCDSTTNTLVTSGASGGCKIDSTTHAPFDSDTWCTTSSVKVTGQVDWVLTLVLDTGNPFQQATLVAELSLGATPIASSTAFTVNPNPGTATVTLTASGPSTPPVTGTLCLKITNQTVDSNPNSGAAHDAKIVTTGTSKIRGPWDPP